VGVDGAGGPPGPSAEPPEPTHPADSPGPPPRAPRPGDPFAGAQTRAAAPRAPRRRRKGRTFFLFLLITGGVLTVGTFLVLFTFRNMTVGFYHDVVVPRGIPEALPPDYPRADAVKLVKALDTFFARADKGEIGDDRVIEVISKIESAMADRRITPEEARELIATAERAGRPEAAVSAPPAVPDGARPPAPGGAQGGGEG
jgi:hypothetical protein